jgi:hypothetical protein
MHTDTPIACCLHPQNRGRRDLRRKNAFWRCIFDYSAYTGWDSESDILDHHSEVAYDFSNGTKISTPSYGTVAIGLMSAPAELSCLSFVFNFFEFSQSIQTFKLFALRVGRHNTKLPTVQWNKIKQRCRMDHWEFSPILKGLNMKFHLIRQNTANDYVVSFSGFGIMTMLYAKINSWSFKAQRPNTYCWFPVVLKSWKNAFYGSHGGWLRLCWPVFSFLLRILVLFKIL